MWGRPVEADGDQTENNQCYTTWESANILKTSKSIIIEENEKMYFILRKKLNGLFGQPNTKD